MFLKKNFEIVILKMTSNNKEYLLNKKLVDIVFLKIICNKKEYYFCNYKKN